MSDNTPTDPIRDQQVFQDLYKNRRERLLASITGMVRDRDRAEDITAAAFQRAWERPAQFRGDSSLDTWLHAIGLNAARRSWREERTAFRDPMDVLETRRHAEPDELSAGLERDELRAQVRMALYRIPAKSRRLLVDHYINGRTLREIARREGVPNGTISSRLFRAARLLREAWQSTPPPRGPMHEERVRQMAEEALNRLAAALEAGRSEVLREFLAAQARFHRYSWHNVMLISAQRPMATRVAGYHTWHELGRYVKKGEKAITIYAPVLVKHDGATLPASKNEREEAVRLAGFRTAHVFDIEQTDGRPLPAFAATRGDPKEYGDKLKGIIVKQNIALEYDPTITPAQGISTGGRIRLVPGLTAAEEFSVLAHEFAHELLHHGKDDARLPKTVRETQAEAVAFVVCQGIGLDTNTAAADYIGLYNGDKQTLAESLAAIHQASTRILSELLPEERIPPAPDRITEPRRTVELSGRESRIEGDQADRLREEGLPTTELPSNRDDSLSLDR
jgi:RNA polymerase sigma factor (sigma-70 family)